jgi:DNA-binding PadR family transcriptional regulator
MLSDAASYEIVGANAVAVIMPQQAAKSQRRNYNDVVVHGELATDLYPVDFKNATSNGGVMAVKDGILAILSLGPGYGLALRDELVTRAPHRAGLNVGQVYSTLDRLGRAGLLASGTMTDDNLPLYTLTPNGSDAVDRWLDVPVAPDPRSWADLLDQVLIGSSLPETDWSALLDRHEAAWNSSVAATAEGGEEVSIRSAVTGSASRLWAQAALAWLDDTRGAFTATDPGLPLRGIRPQRGRRPQSTAPSVA